MLHFEVRDSGIGIPRDKLESIFGSFTQVDSSITRRYGGTGLGLAICKRLVEMMGGRIWAQSDEGRGSAFHFLVRLRAAAEQLPQTSAVGGGRAVLVVSTHEPSAHMLTTVLASWQFSSASCADAGAAPALLAEARQAGRPYSAVLLDVNAAEVTSSLLERLRGGGDSTPVVMLFRPSTVAAGVEKAQHFAATTYLVKPVKRAQLAQALAGLNGQTPAAALAAPAVVSDSTHSARILLVEDNDDNRMLIKAYLRNEPYEIVEAENGEQAVAHFQAGAFDVVLMDVQMPVMDGYAATRAIRAWEVAMQRLPTPVIALTANAVKEDMERSLAAGCDDHLTKPIKKRVLLDALRERLARAA